MLPMASSPERMTEAMRSLEAAFLIGVEGVTEVWLVRHADCYEGMSEGADPQLSPLGRKQAELLANRVRRINVAAIYSSPYRRPSRQRGRSRTMCTWMIGSSRW